jgi:hypothetical protein
MLRNLVAQARAISEIVKQYSEAHSASAVVKG